ncbi:unnamed protein product [Trifolium pratense]|uniref:Uncharacterized protein n=1 Tax=Trifolium pratense TaxID=57577 RepID=A0ACB0LCB2_TRIPR|nr:unnamed protein product [Trifolium pratense]
MTHTCTPPGPATDTVNTRTEGDRNRAWLRAQDCSNNDHLVCSLGRNIIPLASSINVLKNLTRSSNHLAS